MSEDALEGFEVHATDADFFDNCDAQDAADAEDASAASAFLEDRADQGGNVDRFAEADAEELLNVKLEEELAAEFGSCHDMTLRSLEEASQ